MNLAERIQQDGITAESEPTEQPPYGFDNANWWRVTLRMDGRDLTLPFGMGYGLTGKPTAADVLECLLSDASGIENARGDFEEWASEYGYDTDSRKAYAYYQQAEKQTELLSYFLGDKYHAYLWDTESM
jgi:hypothetical protein